MPLRRRLRIEPLEDRRLLAVVTVSTLDDTVDFNDGVTSLREAIFATNLVGGADTIQFAAALTSGGPATLTLTKGELKITDTLSIIGPGADLLTIDASGNDPTPNSTLDDGDELNDGDGSRVFDVDDGNVNTRKTVSIRGLTLTGGDVYGHGGAIRSSENLAVTLIAISDNSASSDDGFDRGGGGGIDSHDGNLNVIRSTISGNSAAYGGGINVLDGDLTVTDSTVSGNSATFQSGGGISNEGGDTAVTGSIISDNSAAGNGGGIVSVYGKMTITASTISGNSGGSGGGVSNVRGDAIVIDSMILGNSAGNGGGIDCFYGDLTVTDSTISGNSANSRGGGIYSNRGNFANFVVTGSTISGNSAGEGGGIFFPGYVMVTDSTISDNSARSDSGGILGGLVTVTNSTISDNSARDEGGGIQSLIATVLTGSTISGNSAGFGGGISSRGQYVVTVSNSTISGNSADYGGGGIRSHSVTVTDSTISDNSAGDEGGGGISGYAVTVTNSTISGNSAGGSGGGILNNQNDRANITVTGSTISGNSAADNGGGIANRVGTLRVTSSTVSNNSSDGSGGGIWHTGTNFSLLNSTLSGNSALGAGGGMYLIGFGTTDAIRHSTITGGFSRMFGGGIFRLGTPLTLDHTIVAGNGAITPQFYFFGQDLTGLAGTVFNARFSLIGDNTDSGLAEAPVGAPDANGNLIGGPVNGTIDPLFGPLIDDGGPTWTHAIGIGSPALDAGDPAAVAGMNGVPEFDQRGNPFIRVVGAAIDVGAFELPPPPPALLGDYNHDGSVDAADYSVWRDTLNANVAPYSSADGSGNGVVDQADCGVWKAHFGQTLPPLAAGSGATAVTALAEFGELSRVEPVLQPAIAAGPPSTLSDGSAAALPARGAALPPADAVFTMLGQRTPARSTVARTALRRAAVDAVVSDSLLLFRRRRVDPTPGDDAVRADDGPRQDTDSRRERMGDLEETWRTVVRESTNRARIVV